MSSSDPTDKSEWQPLTSAHTPERRKGLGPRLGIVGVLVAGVVLLALVLQNSDSAPFRLFWIDANLPLSALVIGTALIAVVLDEACGVIWRRRRRRQLELRDRVG